MRAVWGGFALGVIGLQQQAVLPGWWATLALALLTVCGFVWAVAALSRARCGWVRASGWAAVWIAAACAGSGYAAWRAELRLAQALPVEWEGRELVVTGYIASLPARDANGARFLFHVESYAEPWPAARLPSTIQLTWISRAAPLPRLEPGARWRLPVRLKRPHGNANFRLRDAEVALLERNVRATGYVSMPERAIRVRGDAPGIGMRIERIRARVRERIDAVLAGEPRRGIVIALATGAQDAIDADDWQRMRRTGTSHLVAISGLHLAWVAGVAGGFAGALWRRLRWRGRAAPLLVPAQTVTLCGAVCAAAAYAALAGFNIPVQRALWMLVAAAAAVVCGRNVAHSQILAWALGLVLLRDPWAVTSAGFWLSFCAVGAILFALAGGPRVGGWPGRNVAHGIDANTALDTGDTHGRERSTGSAMGRRARWVTLRRLASLQSLVVAARRCGSALRDGARVQWAVTIALAPLTLYWFAQLPLVGPLANAFAIPWVSFLVTPAVLAGLALPRPLDAFALRIAHALLDGLTTALDIAGKEPWAVLHLPQPGTWALVCAALGVAWWLAPRGWPLRWIAPCMWLPLLLPAPSGPPPGAFRLTALDIGQGTSVLVETTHHTLLFDAGPGPESTHAGERIVVPYLQAAGMQRIDTLMISHDDSDHSGGATAVLEQIGVGAFVAGMVPGHPLWARARAAGAQTVRCAAGQHWQWDGVDFDVLWPDPGPLVGRPNDHCCVLRVSAAAHAPGAEPIAALLAADLEAPAERVLVARDPALLRSQILVVPHHGSRTSSTEPFLDSVAPLIAIFQVGYRNRFHHPQPGVFARYQARRIVLARSDEDGAVRVEAAQRMLTVERYRQTERRYWMDDANR